jgi:phage-related minor tail protein
VAGLALAALSVRGLATALVIMRGALIADCAAKARDIGGEIGSALAGAFTPAENAVGEFVKTGKLGFRDPVTPMIADLAKLAARISAP